MPSATLQPLPAQTEKSGRDFGFDNLRGILIACVVFGHLLEICAHFSSRVLIYQVIYSFHMPALLFLSGYFARYSSQKILFGWFAPYVVFQALYITASPLWGGTGDLQFTTPFWHLWFLLACMFYQLLIPVYDTNSVPKQIAAVACTFALALAVGFDKTVSYTLSLSRFFVFQPWFVLGLYFRKYQRKRPAAEYKIFKYVRNGSILLALIISIIVVFHAGFYNHTFYGSYPYSGASGSLTDRLIVMLISFVWILFFVYILQPLLQRKLPLLTTLGQNTLPVFLLHAFAIKLLPVTLPQLLARPVYLIGIMLGILLLLGNPLSGRIFRFFFSARTYAKALQKRH